MSMVHDQHVHERVHVFVIFLFYVSSMGSFQVHSGGPLNNFPLLLNE